MFSFTDGSVSTVGIPPKEIPKEFTERCRKGELGGVMLVFINGKNTIEIDEKKALIQKYCKRIKKRYEDKNLSGGQ